MPLQLRIDKYDKNRSSRKCLQSYVLLDIRKQKKHKEERTIMLPSIWQGKAPFRTNNEMNQNKTTTGYVHPFPAYIIRYIGTKDHYVV